MSRTLAAVAIGTLALGTLAITGAGAASAAPSPTSANVNRVIVFNTSGHEITLASLTDDFRREPIANNAIWTHSEGEGDQLTIVEDNKIQLMVTIHPGAKPEYVGSVGANVIATRSSSDELVFQVIR